MNSKIIVIDGKTYNRVEDMPPDVRQKYEEAMGSLRDANGNRVPDVFENMNMPADRDKNGVLDVIENLVAGQAMVNNMKIIVDGKEFNGIEGLPPEARARYEEAMGQLDANKNGIPDFVEGMMNAANQNQAAPSTTGFSVETPPRPTPIQASPTITPDTSNGLMLGLAGLFVFLLCVVAAGAVWYFFLR
jgi:hypothetical protein